MKTTKQSKKTGRKRGSRRRGPYPFELKLRAVKLYLEEEYTPDLIVEELGMGKSTLSGWVRSETDGRGPVFPLDVGQADRCGAVTGRSYRQHIKIPLIEKLAQRLHAVGRVGQAVDQQDTAFGIFGDQLKGPVPVLRIVFRVGRA